MSNSDAPSRHRRKPAMTTRNRIAAMRIASGSSFTFQESLPRTDGRACLCFPRRLCSPKREAERRTAHQQLPRLDAQARPRPDKRTARLSALLRGHAPGFYSRLGPGRASWNHRMQTGGPSPAPVQRAPRSPARAGRADTQTACRLTATNSARRNRTRSVSRRHRLTSLTMNGMDAVIQIRNGAVKGFLIYADKTRGCAARLPLCASPDAFHSVLKIRKSEVVPVNQGFLCSERSPDERQRNPGWWPGLPRISFHSIRATLAVGVPPRRLQQRPPLNSSYALPGTQLGRSGRHPLPAVPKCSGLPRSTGRSAERA
jgi:hypothetical protein